MGVDPWATSAAEFSISQSGSPNPSFFSIAQKSKFSLHLRRNFAVNYIKGAEKQVMAI